MSGGTVIPARHFGPRRATGFLFVERRRWPLAVTVAALVGLGVWPTVADDSSWLAVGAALITLITWHSLVVGRRLPWIPGLALATAALQWVIAPWLSYRVGAAFALFDMVIPPAQYFAYAVPALAALALGMVGVLRRPGRSAMALSSAPLLATVRFRRTCDAMVIVGVVTRVLVAPVLGQGSLAFVAVLVGNLAFVGALALLLARAPGWPLRALAVLGVQGVVSAANGMFHDLVLWTAYFCLTFISVYRLRARTIIPLVAAGLAAIMVLNVIKRQFRETLITTEAGMLGRAAILGSTLMESAADPEVAYEGTGLRANVTRLNQGWIIARVIRWVPQREPFANGETILASVRATLLPRILDPNKLELGGRTYFERFTGLALYRTSMDLSIAGEMYANYGYWGGLLGIFIFGALVGGAYRAFVRLGRRSTVWWAWAPFVLLTATRAENSLAEVTNHLLKSGIVMVAVISFVPAWAMLRRPLREGILRATGRRRALGEPTTVARGTIG